MNMIWDLKSLVDYCNKGEVMTSNGVDGYVPARPLQWGGVYGMLLRIKAAWSVLIGRADAFMWPQGQ